MTKKIILTFLLVAVFATLGVGMAVSSASAYDTTIEEWGIEYFNQLDYGLYWYADKDNVVPTKNYVVDKEKPTIVYVHGWKPEESAVREGFSLKSLSEQALKKKKLANYAYDPEFYRYYIDQGYNVGVFYWNLLADNGLGDFTVDSRIWFSNEGKNMRYRTYAAPGAKAVTSDEDDPTNPKKSVALLYADALIEALGKDYEGFLHLSGHSMGGQLTLAVTEALCVMRDKGELPTAFLPDRVTILDPYIDGFSGYEGTVDHLGKHYDDIKIAQLVANATDTIRQHGIPIEAYGCNLQMVFRNYTFLLLTSPDDEELRAECDVITETLGKNCVWVYIGENSLNFFGGFSPTHVMTVDYYFTTNNFSVRKSVEGVRVPSAQMPVEELQDLIGLTFKQSVENKYDENPLYYSSGTFEIVDFATMQKSEESFGRISGQLKVEDRKGAEITAKAIDADGEVKATANVDESGRYYLKGLAEGEYAVAFFARGKEIARIDGVNTTGTMVPVYAEEIEAEVPQAMDTILMVAVLGLCLVLVIVAVATLVHAIVVNKRKKRANSI